MKLIHTNNKNAILLTSLLLWSFVCFTQNTVSISNSSTVSLEFASPYNPGSNVSNVSDDSKWLNYTVLQTPPEPTFSITAQISSGTNLSGMELRMEAGSYVGQGGGQPGTSSGQIVLSSEPQTIIYNIGTCSTGAGINVGHQLSYSLIITNYSQLRASSASMNILYTITQ